MDARVADAIGSALLTTLQEQEAKLDSQIEQLEQLEDDDIDKIRERRRKELMKKFVRINAEKAPFLCERLKIWMIPTIQLVKDQQSVHQITGFDPLGGSDKFSTQYLAWYISQHGVLSYDGPIPKTPFDISTSNGTMALNRKPKTSIRESQHNSEYDSDE